MWRSVTLRCFQNFHFPSQEGATRHSQGSTLNNSSNFELLALIAGEEVASVAGGGEVLGWFVQQNGPPRQPSIRERTVTAAMAACVPPGMPVVFAQIFTSFEANRSTFSFQQRYLQQVGMGSASVILKAHWRICVCIQKGN